MTISPHFPLLLWQARAGPRVLSGQLSNFCQPSGVRKTEDSHHASALGSDSLSRGVGPGNAVPCQADSDEHLISLWLHGRGPHTRRAWAAELRRFQEFIEKPIQAVRLDDLQRFIDSLEDLAARAVREQQRLSRVFCFAHRIGYLRFDVGAAVATPKTRNRLSERILTEGQVIAMIVLEPNKIQAVDIWRPDLNNGGHSQAQTTYRYVNANESTVRRRRSSTRSISAAFWKPRSRQGHGCCPSLGSGLSYLEPGSSSSTTMRKSVSLSG